VFFITGREEGPELRAATEDNLKKAGYAKDWAPEDWVQFLIMKGTIAKCGKDNTTRERALRRISTTRSSSMSATSGAISTGTAGRQTQGLVRESDLQGAEPVLFHSVN